MVVDLAMLTTESLMTQDYDRRPSASTLTDEELRAEIHSLVDEIPQLRTRATSPSTPSGQSKELAWRLQAAIDRFEQLWREFNWRWSELEN